MSGFSGYKYISVAGIADVRRLPTAKPQGLLFPLRLHWQLRAVPPVGVEPTLGTLLGGRPLPLGYGGGFIIPPVQLPNRGVTTTSSIILPSGCVYCIQIAERD